MKRKRLLPTDHGGGDPTAFLPAPVPVEHVHHKIYADYLREAKPSKHEDTAHSAEHGADVQAAIERVRQAPPAAHGRLPWRTQGVTPAQVKEIASCASRSTTPNGYES